MSVFATVGTTKFTALMETLDKEDVQAALAAKGYKRLLVQTGYDFIGAALLSCHEIQAECHECKQEEYCSANETSRNRGVYVPV